MKIPTLFLTSLISLSSASSFGAAATWVCEDSTVRFEFNTGNQSVFMESPALPKKELEVESFEQQEGCEPCLEAYANYVQNRFQKAYFRLVLDDEGRMDGWIRGNPILPFKKVYNDVPCTLAD